MATVLDIIGNPTEHLPGANFPNRSDSFKNSGGFRDKICYSGDDLINLENALAGKPFIGTTVG